MDSNARKNFWDVLNSLHDNSESSINKLVGASPLPKTLCRFRPVNKNSLQQLNNNTLYFSSADRYDDPFDTYFYIDVNQMIPVYEEMRKALFVGNEGFMQAISQIAKLAGKDPNEFVKDLLKKDVDFSHLNGQLMMVRNSIQKRLFSICFCEDEYNETLWLKYANNYQGFVLIYDLQDPNTFLCGKGTQCTSCLTAQNPPNIYPVYYSDERYDATKCALGMLLYDKVIGYNPITTSLLPNIIQQSIMWELERVSLIKKKCHENDQEWRMIRPTVSEQRSFYKMKPSKVIIGLRTPEYESRLIVSAAVNAGIKEVHKLYINDKDLLDSAPIPDNLYHI